VSSIPERPIYCHGKAILINSARGGMVVDEDLIASLKAAESLFWMLAVDSMDAVLDGRPEPAPLLQIGHDQSRVGHSPTVIPRVQQDAVS
jgi:hypothetical protein